jgi:D-xylulose reductase
VPEKLALFADNPAVTTVDVRNTKLADTVKSLTDGWGANVVFEASGSARAFDDIFELLCPGGCLVMVGMPAAKVAFDIVAIQAKEARIESVFRYANIFPRALALIASGQVDVKPFISRTFAFEDGIRAFEEAAAGRATDVKIQIEFAEPVTSS